MSLKTHIPLAIAATAIIATQIGCAWLTNQAIRRYAPDSNERELSDLAGRLDEIEKNTKSIDARLMTPSERWEKLKAGIEARQLLEKLEQQKR